MQSAYQRARAALEDFDEAGGCSVDSADETYAADLITDSTPKKRPFLEQPSQWFDTDAPPRASGGEGAQRRGRV